MAAKEPREGHLDLAAGILMLWVMTFHALNNAKVFGDIDARVAIPYLTFSMGWFFYKSGAFFHKDRGVEGIRKDVRRLLVPFLKWSALPDRVDPGSTYLRQTQEDMSFFI